MIEDQYLFLQVKIEFLPTWGQSFYEEAFVLIEIDHP
jgi:hypothetical protein